MPISQGFEEVFFMPQTGIKRAFEPAKILTWQGGVCLVCVL